LLGHFGKIFHIYKYIYIICAIEIFPTDLSRLHPAVPYDLHVHGGVATAVLRPALAGLQATTGPVDRWGYKIATFPGGNMGKCGKIRENMRKWNE
jgi:hypothetical protein